MDEDLDLERVVNDPVYRRKAIEDLKRAEERPEQGDARRRRGEGQAAPDADGNAE